MSSWSSRRKLAFILFGFIVLIIFVASIYFLFIYKVPACTDGIMNGTETGVDCGGSCVKLCQNSFLPPNIVWGGAKFEKVTDELYNVAALISNQNINGAATDVPYRISLYDDRGILIKNREGKVTLYPHRNSLAFDSAINVGKRVPAKAIFEFLQAPVWFKSHDALDGIAIINKKYTDDNNSSSLEVTLENRTLFPYEDILVSVVLYDKDGNAIGFSKTIIDSIEAKNGRVTAPFTWPIDRKGAVTSIEVIPIISPTADR